MLEHYTVQTLEVPAEGFDASGIIEMVITGGTYGGEWALNVVLPGQTRNEPYGSMETEPAAMQADAAIESAQKWVADQAAEQGLEVVEFVNLNAHYKGTDSEGFFAGASFKLRRTSGS